MTKKLLFLILVFLGISTKNNLFAQDPQFSQYYKIKRKFNFQ
jgi:hypothetical protein